MERASIDGRPVALDAAIAEAARLLGASRLPVIAGLDCDVLGAREAVALARRLGGVCDHVYCGMILPALDAMREAGAIVTTPNEARLRADTWLMVGSSMGVDWPDIVERVRPPFESDGGTKAHRMWWLCPDDRQRTGDTARRYARVIGRSNGELPALLAALRARVAKRPVNSGLSSPRKRGSITPDGAIRVHGFPRSRERLKDLDALAAELNSAKFGVAVWSTQDLDALATEMLFGLIDDLNTHTRFAGLPLTRGTVQEVMQACGWLSGFPCPVGFGRGVPEHDPWRFDADRLVESGEADCAVWISTIGYPIPPWQRSVPVIVIGRHPSVAAARAQARIHIDVGQAGIDHHGLLHCLDTGTIVPAAALRPSDAPSVAEVLARLAAALPERPPC